MSCHFYCSWWHYVARTGQYKALQLINFYLRQVYTNVAYRVRTCRTGNSVNRSTQFSLRDHITSASAQRPVPRSRQTATRYARWVGQDGWSNAPHPLHLSLHFLLHLPLLSTLSHFLFSSPFPSPDSSNFNLHKTVRQRLPCASMWLYDPTRRHLLRCRRTTKIVWRLAESLVRGPWMPRGWFTSGMKNTAANDVLGHGHLRSRLSSPIRHQSCPPLQSQLNDSKIDIANVLFTDSRRKPRCHQYTQMAADTMRERVSKRTVQSDCAYADDHRIRFFIHLIANVNLATAHRVWSPNFFLWRWMYVVTC